MGDEVRISDVVERIASFLNLPFSFSLIGLQKGEKLREELYDGPVTKTKFTSISKSVHKIKTGLIDDLRSELPIDNNQSLLILNKLLSKYLFQIELIIKLSRIIDTFTYFFPASPL